MNQQQQPANIVQAWATRDAGRRCGNAALWIGPRPQQDAEGYDGLGHGIFLTVDTFKLLFGFLPRPGECLPVELTARLLPPEVEPRKPPRAFAGTASQIAAERNA